MRVASSRSTPSRETVALTATMPSSGVSSMMSVIRSIVSSERSGETFSRMGRYWFCPRRNSKSGSRIFVMFSRVWYDAAFCPGSQATLIVK